MFSSLDLPEGGAIFFFNHDLGDGIGESSLPGCVPLCLIRGADRADRVELNR
jgi:hypothetical protein